MTKKYFDKVKELKKAKKSLPPQITEQKQVEEALQENENKYRGLFESSKDALMILAPPNWLFTAGNPATIEMFRANDEKEFTSKGPWEISPKYQPDGQLSSEKSRKMIEEAMKIGSNFFEWTHKRFDGEDFPSNVLLTRFELEGKKSLQATVRDITKQKQIEKKLARIAAEQENIMGTISDGIYTLDMSGNLVNWNKAAEVVTGLSTEELTGKPIVELFAEKDRSAVAEAITKGLKEGIGEVTGSFLRKDRSPAIYQWSTVPLKDPQGKVIGLTGVGRDITEQKRIEEELARIAAEQKNIMGTISDGIYMLDMSGKLVNWNKAAELVSGLSAKELTGKPIVELFAEEDRTAVAEAITKGLKEGIGEVTGSFLRKGRSPAIYQWSTVPLKDPQGKVIGLTGVGRDITESKHVEESIKASLKEKDVLLQEIHHRVKNNLQVMSSLINIQAKSIKDKDTIEMLSESRNRINAMALIHAQLYESKDLSEVNIKKFADALLRQLLQSYPVQGAMITPSIRVADFPLPISVATPVGLIVNELLTNTFKYAFTKRKKGKIEVRLDVSEKEKIELTVSDDGVGLPQEFDINTTKTLGLHLVKILVEDQLQGKLAIIREKGTTFRIEFEIDSV